MKALVFYLTTAALCVAFWYWVLKLATTISSGG
jgi:hypothetical protein